MDLVPSRSLYQKINSSQMTYVMWQVRLLITVLPSGVKIYESLKYFLNLCLRVEWTEAERSPLSSLLSNTLEIAEQKVSLLLNHFALMLHLLPYQCLCFVPLNKNHSGILHEIHFQRVHSRALLAPTVMHLTFCLYKGKECPLSAQLSSVVI